MCKENKKKAAEDFTNINKAAVMICDEILFKNISQLIEYRKKIAIEIFNNNPNEDTYKYLRDLYEDSERQLKELLGIS